MPLWHLYYSIPLNYPEQTSHFFPDIGFDLNPLELLPPPHFHLNWHVRTQTQYLEMKIQYLGKPLIIDPHYDIALSKSRPLCKRIRFHIRYHQTFHRQLVMHPGDLPPLPLPIHQNRQGGIGNDVGWYRKGKHGGIPQPVILHQHPHQMTGWTEQRRPLTAGV